MAFGIKKKAHTIKPSQLKRRMSGMLWINIRSLMLKSSQVTTKKKKQKIYQSFFLCYVIAIYKENVGTKTFKAKGKKKIKRSSNVIQLK